MKQWIMVRYADLVNRKRLPYFRQDFNCNRVFMIAELPGEAEEWRGLRRENARLGNTHAWNRYFDRSLQTNPRSVAEVAFFLRTCRYLCDQKIRGLPDYWEPPDQFEVMKAGDCEDHAIWAWRHLCDLGYRARFVLGNYECWHAWVHIFVNGRAYLMETTQKHNIFPDVSAYEPWWSVERSGNQRFSFFRHPGYTRNGA
jgi:hypothetical protein